MSESKKPRLAEVLGVEVGEEITIQMFATTYHVDKYGILRGENNLIDNFAAVYAVNHPEEVKRIPRWTKEEVQDARAIQRLMPKYTRIYRSNKNLLLENQCGVSYPLDINLFPSLATGQTVKLADIIGGGE